MFIPHVHETIGKSEKIYDLYSRLLKERIIFIGSAIDDNLANSVVAQFLFLQMEDPNKDIKLYINSPGGVITSGMAIYDAMHHVTCDVETYCIGCAASMASVLLSAGTKGKRYALPNSTVMIHQPLGGAQGQASDIEITANRILGLKDKLTKILSDNSNKTYDQVRADMDRDYWLSAVESKEYGLVDHIL